jgi:hypothetical protein
MHRVRQLADQLPNDRVQINRAGAWGGMTCSRGFLFTHDFFLLISKFWVKCRNSPIIPTYKEKNSEKALKIVSNESQAFDI